jgi:uncharacterized integral membrane protein
MTDERPEEPAAPSSPPPPSDSGLSFGLAFFLLFAVGFVVFVVQNSGPVEVRFLAWEGSFPLPLILVVTALLAVLADQVLGAVRRRRRRRRLADQQELERYRRT